jgi:hypothetical protein
VTNLSTGAMLFVCVIYAFKHRGSDAPGMVLAFTLGVVSHGSALGALAEPIIALISAVWNAIVEGINGLTSGKSPAPTPANGLVALRYNLALLGIGR